MVLRGDNAGNPSGFFVLCRGLLVNVLGCSPPGGRRAGRFVDGFTRLA